MFGIKMTEHEKTYCKLTPFFPEWFEGLFLKDGHVCDCRGKTVIIDNLIARLNIEIEIWKLELLAGELESELFEMYVSENEFEF